MAFHTGTGRRNKSVQFENVDERWCPPFPSVGVEWQRCPTHGARSFGKAISRGNKKRAARHCRIRLVPSICKVVVLSYSMDAKSSHGLPSSPFRALSHPMADCSCTSMFRMASYMLAGKSCRVF